MTCPAVVSVVIPTRNRPALVRRAVLSALDQTFRDIEVLVVVDGPDPKTAHSLSEIKDSRLRVISLNENVGGSEARNIGVRNATGPWVALLDDDDEWMPGKLEKQFNLTGGRSGNVLIASRFLDRMFNRDLVRPTKFPRRRQDISEFLFCEVGWLGGITGFPQTSSWLGPRSLFLQIPFTTGLRCLQDIDWLLRAHNHEPEMDFAFVPEPMVIFHNDVLRPRVTTAVAWRHSLEWAESNELLFTPRAFAFFILIFCINPAARARAPWREIIKMTRKCLSRHIASPRLFWLLTLYTLIYPSLTRFLSISVSRMLVYRASHPWRATPKRSH